MNNLQALLILNAIPKLSNRTTHKLIAHYGNAAMILSLSAKELMDSSIVSKEVAESIVNFSKEQFLEEEYQRVNEANISIISFEDEGYPQLLKQIVDAPVILYVKGVLRKDDVPVIGVVGSRTASLYGQQIAEQWSRQLAELGMIIVSGLARGIDTAAHQGVLKANGETVAVLGCGLSHVYPPENRQLMEKISATGAVISEFPMATPPLAYNFPRRNRIISGLSQGVIVVEAAEKSGALITADFAIEQGREVYAIPGKIDSPSSKGVNNLIKQGAKLVTSIEDILEDLKDNLLPVIQNKENVIKNVKQESLPELNDQEQNVYRFLGQNPIHIDELVFRCSSTPTNVSMALLKLEMKKLVKQLPGKMFVGK